MGVLAARVVLLSLAILIVAIIPSFKLPPASGTSPILWIISDESSCDAPFPGGAWDDNTSTCTLSSLVIDTDDLEIGYGVTAVLPAGETILVRPGAAFGVYGGNLNVNSGTINTFEGGILYVNDGILNVNSGNINSVFGGVLNVNSGGVVNVNSSSTIYIAGGSSFDINSGGTVNINSGGVVKIGPGGGLYIHAGGILNVNAGGMIIVEGLGGVTLEPGGIVSPGDVNLVSAKPGNATFDSPLLVKGRAVKFKLEIENSFPFDIVVPIQYQKSAGQSGNSFSEDIVLKPGDNSLLFPSGAGPEISKDDESICFEITIDPTNLIQEENEANNEFTTCPQLAETKNLRIHFMPIEIKENSISGYPDCSSIVTMELKNYFYLREALPVPNVQPFITCESAGTFESAGHANIILGQYSWFSGEPGYPHYDYFVGVAKAGAFDGAGESFSPESNQNKPTHSVVVDERFNSGGVTAHELAHTQGWVTIGHPNECENGFEGNGLRHLCDSSKAAGYPAPGYFSIHDCELGFYDFSAPSGEECDVSEIPFDFMYPKAYVASGENTVTWVSKLTWEYLASAFAVGPDNDPPVIGVSGLIHEDGTVEVGPWYRFDGILDIPLDNPGKYTLLYLDGGDNQIARTGFDGLHSAHLNSGPDAFLMRIPDVEGTAKIVIKLEDAILVERVLSDSIPSTTIISPNGGELFEPGDIINVEWQSSDLDGDSLTHTLFLSQDGGQFYIPIASQLTGNEFAYQIPGDLLSSAIMVKVVTTDGVNTAIDQSDGPFSTTIDITPPTVTGLASRPPDVNGYYTAPVTITWIGDDHGGSGIASCDPPIEYSGPAGSSILLTGHCVDNSENVGTGTITINYDNPPDCSRASPSVALLQPDKNHSFKSITIRGVTDTDGDPITIRITGIRQDEPVNSSNDGNTFPDGKGIGTNTAQVRAERSGVGDGRVYHIYFEASDGYGLSCTGEVLVKVPLSTVKKNAVDQGALFDSTSR